MKRMAHGDGDDFEDEFVNSPKKTMYPGDTMIKVEEGVEPSMMDSHNNMNCSNNLDDLDPMKNVNDIDDTSNNFNGSCDMIGNSPNNMDGNIHTNSVSDNFNVCNSISTTDMSRNNINVNSNIINNNDLNRNNNSFNASSNIGGMSGRNNNERASVENQLLPSAAADDLPVPDVIRSFKYTAECLNKKRQMNNSEYNRMMQQRMRQNFHSWGGPSDTDGFVNNPQQPNGYLRHSPVNQPDLYASNNPMNQRKNSPPMGSMQRNANNSTSPNPGSLRNNLPPSVFRNNIPSNIYKNSTSPINFRTDSSGNILRNSSPPNGSGTNNNLRMNSVPPMRSIISPPDIVPGNNSYQQPSMNSYTSSISRELNEKPEIRKATVKHSEREEIWALLQTELRKKYHNAILKKIRYTDCDNDEISIYKNSELSDAIFNEGITKFRLFYQIFEVTYVARNSAASTKSKETNDFFGTRKCYPSPNMAWNLFSSSVMDISTGVRMKYVLYTDRQGCSITVATANELDQAIFVEGITKFCICFDVTSNVSSSSSNGRAESGIALVKY